jgi:uncharacterized protein (DUF608 family)
MNDKDSRIPSAMFFVQFHNNTKKPVDYTVYAILKNPLPKNTINRFNKQGDVKLIQLTSNKYDKSLVEFGDMTLATDAEDVSYQQYWFRGMWFDSLEVYWHDITKPGKLVNRTYPEPDKDKDIVNDDHCMVAVHFKLGPNQKKHARFVITWNFPNVTNYWNPETPKTWKNYYSVLFKDSTESAKYCLTNWDRLFDETLKFKQALYSSTVPAYVLDAVSANISILKSPTVLRLEDGSFYGFEGCNCSCGCCEGSCTHVWNYAYALPFLFPNLERSMRELEYKYTMRDDGKLGFRLQLPLGRQMLDLACADGQFGTVIKCYREWKISGDDKWLQSIWPKIKKSIEFAWQPTNEHAWDMDKDGVLEGRQHQTLDTELFGPNTYLTGFYLGALKAGAEIAEHFGEHDKAKEYDELFKKGKQWVDKNLFNGEYYHQKIDLKDKNILEKYANITGKRDDGMINFYWNDEHKQIRFQIAEGCHIDQIVAQWHANLIGLGEIFNKSQVKTSLRSVYKHNYKKTMRNFFNPCRIYALNNEAATVICHWPEGKQKPIIPAMYSEEAMNGFEYAVACHMIQEGLVKEGLQIVKSVRDRYNGENRNPWNEFECGSNYARSMASYSVLLGLSGFEYDMTKKHLGFNPLISKNNFTCFWSIDNAWGTYNQKNGKATLTVLYGELALNSFKTGNKTTRFKSTVRILPAHPLTI